MNYLGQEPRQGSESTDLQDISQQLLGILLPNLLCVSGQLQNWMFAVRKPWLRNCCRTFPAQPSKDQDVGQTH